MTTLLIADHDNSTLSDATAKAMSAALALGEPVHILVAGSDCAKVADQAAQLSGAQKVILVEDAALAHHLAEPMAALIVTLADGYDALLMAASTAGKNMMPRVAALLDVMQISDVMEVVDALTFKRPIYAGNAIQTVKSSDPKRVITVRTASFASADMANAAPIETASVADDPQLSKFVENRLSESDRPELQSSKIVVSGGRALGSEEKFQEVIMPVADALGAAVGASRAAVDAGYAPNDWQVGQTGKVVAPDLYVACGISGAIQHLAGMKDSKVIVAINKDEDAPIFQVADYGLVADLFEVLPKFTEEVARAKAG